jgi:hypothetical protein
MTNTAQTSPYDWNDMSFAMSRGVANAVFTVIEEFQDGCGPLMFSDNLEVLYKVSILIFKANWIR